MSLWVRIRYYLPEIFRTSGYICPPPNLLPIKLVFYETEYTKEIKNLNVQRYFMIASIKKCQLRKRLKFKFKSHTLLFMLTNSFNGSNFLFHLTRILRYPLAYVPWFMRNERKTSICITILLIYI